MPSWQGTSIGFYWIWHYYCREGLVMKSQQTSLDGKIKASEAFYAHDAHKPHGMGGRDQSTLTLRGCDFSWPDNLFGLMAPELPREVRTWTFEKTMDWNTISKCGVKADSASGVYQRTSLEWNPSQISWTQFTIHFGEDSKRPTLVGKDLVQVEISALHAGLFGGIRAVGWGVGRCFDYPQEWLWETP